MKYRVVGYRVYDSKQRVVWNTIYTGAKEARDECDKHNNTPGAHWAGQTTRFEVVEEAEVVEEQS